MQQLSAPIDSVSSPVMEYLGSPNVLNDQQVLPINQLGDNTAMTVQLPAFEGEHHHLLGSQPSPRTTEELIVTGRVQPVLGQQQTTVTSDQQPHQLEDYIVVDMTLQIPNPEAEAEDDLPELGLGHFSIQGRFESAVAVALGPNRSNPIWRLILIAAFNLVAAAMAGVLFLPGNLEGVHATYWRVMLIMSVGVPIAVAMITFFISFWLASNPDGRNNWVTGLSVANFSLLFAPLAVYLVLK